MKRTLISRGQSYADYNLEKAFRSSISNSPNSKDLFYFFWQSSTNRGERLSEDSKRTLERYAKSKELASRRQDLAYVKRTIDFVENLVGTPLGDRLNLTYKDLEDYRKRYYSHARK